MAKLPVVSSRDLIKYLAKRGFKYAPSKGTHHSMQKGERVSIIPNRKELGKGALLAILKKAGISKDEFIKDFRGKRLR